jgi:hypothetical protein
MKDLNIKDRIEEDSIYKNNDTIYSTEREISSGLKLTNIKDEGSLVNFLCCTSSFKYNSHTLRSSDLNVLSNDEFEECHNFIQYFFPTDTPSNFNKDCPLFPSTSSYLYDLNKSEARIAFNIRTHNFMKRLGFTKRLGYTINSDYLIDDFIPENSISNWYEDEFNHNRLRITRVLRHSILMTKYTSAQDMYTDLYRNVVSVVEDYESEGDSVGYWKEAIGEV